MYWLISFSPYLNQREYLESKLQGLVDSGLVGRGTYKFKGEENIGCIFYDDAENPCLLFNYAYGYIINRALKKIDIKHLGVTQFSTDYKILLEDDEAAAEIHKKFQEEIMQKNPIDIPLNPN